MNRSPIFEDLISKFESLMETPMTLEPGVVELGIFLDQIVFDLKTVDNRLQLSPFQATMLAHVLAVCAERAEPGVIRTEKSLSQEERDAVKAEIGRNCAIRSRETTVTLRFPPNFHGSAILSPVIAVIWAKMIFTVAKKLQSDVDDVLNTKISLLERKMRPELYN